MSDILLQIFWVGVIGFILCSFLGMDVILDICANFLLIYSWYAFLVIIAVACVLAIPIGLVCMLFGYKPPERSPEHSEEEKLREMWQAERKANKEEERKYRERLSGKPYPSYARSMSMGARLWGTWLGEDSTALDQGFEAWKRARDRQIAHDTALALRKLEERRRDTEIAAQYREKRMQSSLEDARWRAHEAKMRSASSREQTCAVAVNRPIPGLSEILLTSAQLPRRKASSASASTNCDS